MRSPRVATPLLGAAGLLGLAAACWWLGRGALPAPPVTSPGALGGWVEDLGPAGAAMALVRVAVTGVAGWLGAAMLAHLVLEAVAPASPIRSATARLVPAAARHLVSVLAGAGLGGAAVVTVAAPALAGDPPATATLRELPAPSPVHDGPLAVLRSLDVRPDEGGGSGTAPAATLSELHPGDAHDPGSGRVRAEDATATVEPGRGGRDADRTVADDAEPGLDVWSVEPGESFWSIATEVLADRWGRPPSDGEVTPYWRALVEANADRLVTGDPDLLYAGQVLVLPDGA